MIETGTNGARAASLKERQREERAALILRAASDLLIEKGYHDASMDEIAARVGISKGALYLHFTSKEALVVRLLEQEIAEYLALIDQVARQKLYAHAGCLKHSPALKNFLHIVTQNSHVGNFAAWMHGFWHCYQHPRFPVFGQPINVRLLCHLQRCFIIVCCERLVRHAIAQYN